MWNTRGSSDGQAQTIDQRSSRSSLLKKTKKKKRVAEEDHYTENGCGNHRVAHVVRWFRYLLCSHPDFGAMLELLMMFRFDLVR